MEALKVFNDTLLKFKENLKKIDDTIEIKKIGSIDTVPLQNFLKAIDGKEEKIKNKDSSIFNEPLNLDDVDLSAVFAKISKEENRESVWKYLNTLVLISKTIKSKSKRFEEMFEKEDGVPDMMEMLKNMMGSDGDAEADDDTDADADKEDSGDDEDLVGMLENSKIGSLAKDIASNIDISSLENDIKLDSPDINSIISSLSTNDSIKGLMNRVTTSLQEKMETGELNHADLKSEAMEMFDKIKKNKKIKKMMKKGGNMQGLMKEMMKQNGMPGMPGMPGMSGTGDDEDFGDLEEMFKKNKTLPPPDFNALRGGGRRNAVRKRLKKKLEKKED